METEFLMSYHIHIQVLMMNIYGIDIVAKASRGEKINPSGEHFQKYPPKIQS